MKCLLGTLLLAALAVSARQPQTTFPSRPDSYGQDAQQQLALEHYTDLFSDRDFSSEGLPDRQSPFLSVFREQFSAKTSDDSEVFYHRFRQLALQDTSKISSFTVTKDPSFNLLGFANANRDILQIRPIEDGTENTISRTVFMQPLRKRDGGGGIGKSIDFAGWEVSWRGMRFEIWQASWVKNYQQFTQYHIIGRNPSSSFPIDLAQPFSLKTANSSRIVSTIATGPDAADLLILEVGAWNSVVRDAILVFDQGFWSEDRLLYQGILGADWKDVILSESLKRSVRHEYTSFFSAEAIYKNLGVAWKRGVIFLGPPGNGKTISVKAMMRDLVLGLDVGEEKKTVLYVRSFHTYMGDEYGIKQIFRRARREASCLLVFEDVDSLITEMNRSFFLNEVDGLEDNDGLLMLATTNHFEKLDPALSNRPSRFDRKYTFPDPVVAERRQYAVYWQKKLASNKEIKFPDSLLDEFAKKTGGFSFAYMKEAFVSALLTLAGNEEHKKKEFPIVLMQQVKALRAELEKSLG